MSAAPQRITLPQVLVLMVIWATVIYGVTAKRPSDVEQISLKKPALAACDKQG